VSSDSGPGAEIRQQRALVAIIDRLREAMPELVRDVAADLGESDQAVVASTVQRSWT